MQNVPLLFVTVIVMASVLVKMPFFFRPPWNSNRDASGFLNAKFFTEHTGSSSAGFDLVRV